VEAIFFYRDINVLLPARCNTSGAYFRPTIDDVLADSRQRLKRNYRLADSPVLIHLVPSCAPTS